MNVFFIKFHCPHLKSEVSLYPTNLPTSVLLAFPYLHFLSIPTTAFTVVHMTHHPDSSGPSLMGFLP